MSKKKKMELLRGRMAKKWHVGDVFRLSVYALLPENREPFRFFGVFDDEGYARAKLVKRYEAKADDGTTLFDIQLGRLDDRNATCEQLIIESPEELQRRGLVMELSSKVTPPLETFLFVMEVHGLFWNYPDAFRLWYRSDNVARLLARLATVSRACRDAAYRDDVLWLRLARTRWPTFHDLMMTSTTELKNVYGSNLSLPDPRNRQYRVILHPFHTFATSWRAFYAMCASYQGHKPDKRKKRLARLILAHPGLKSRYTSYIEAESS